LERRATEVNVAAYAISAEGLLQLFYVPLGGSAEPGGGIAEVKLREQTDAVEVSLAARLLDGIYPDGAGVAYAAVWQADCLAVELSQPLGARKVVDGHSGRAVRKVEQSEPGSDDAAFLRAASHRGCPVWTI
jgi:hypothetical protein